MKTKYLKFTRLHQGEIIDISWDRGNGLKSKSEIYLGCDNDGPILIDESYLSNDAQPIPLDLESIGYPSISILNKKGVLPQNKISSLLRRLQE